MSDVERSRGSGWRGVSLDVGVLVLAWIVATIVVDPRGDFPLNDDWMYGRTVQTLVEHATYRDLRVSAPIALTHVLWGALVCAPFGFSFTALRISTLALGLVGVVGTYLLVREVGRSRLLALGAALTVGFNPIYFALSHTFMTDVAFTAMQTLSLLFLVRALRSAAVRDLLLGAAFLAAATLCRQPAIAVGLAFVPAQLSLRRRPPVGAIGRACIPLAFSLAALATSKAFQASSVVGLHRLNLTYALHRSAEFYARFLARNALIDLIYLGLFLLPLLVLGLRPSRDRQGAWRWIGALAAMLLVALAHDMVLPGRSMPLFGNVLTTAGIGPYTLRDCTVLDLHLPEAIPAGARVLATALGIAGAGVLASHVVRGAKRVAFPAASGGESVDRSRTILLIASALTYGCFLILLKNRFDRYLVPLLPVWCGIVALGTLAAPTFRLEDRWRWPSFAVASVALLGLGAGSVALARDYVAWNRVRWTALNQLTIRDGIPPTRIDGGYEFNGWYLYGEVRPRTDSGKSRWWVEDDEYMVTLGPLPDYDVVREYPVDRWLPPEGVRICVLRRQER